LLPSGGSLAVEEATTTLELVIRLPDGYIPAEGFRQQIAVVTPAGDGPALDPENLDLDQPLSIPLPDGGRFSLSLTIGYCDENAKDICYVDRAALSIVRTAGSSLESPETLIFRPGAHL